LEIAERQFSRLQINGVSPLYRAFSWDVKTIGVSLLLAQITGKQEYHEHAQKYFRECFFLPSGSAGDVAYTSGGLAVRGYGTGYWVNPLMYSSTTAFLALVYRDNLPPGDEFVEDLDTFARSQINYMLGENQSRQSYVVRSNGVGPRRVHHRAASCPSDYNIPCNPSHDDAAYENESFNPIALVGALVGGPVDSDFWKDRRPPFDKNGVTLDTNAGWTGVVLRLHYLEGHCIGLNKDPFEYGSEIKCCGYLPKYLGNFDPPNDHQYRCLHPR
jgi:hypothetical protein